MLWIKRVVCIAILLLMPVFAFAKNRQVGPLVKQWKQTTQKLLENGSNEELEERWMHIGEQLKKHALKGNEAAFHEILEAYSRTDGYMAEFVFDLIFELYKTDPSPFRERLSREDKELQKNVWDSIRLMEEPSR